MPAGKQYEVLVGFHEVVDDKGNEKRYEVGDTYAGKNADKHLEGHDDQGPLIAEKSSSTGDASKEN